MSTDMGDTPGETAIDTKLLELICCPLTKGVLSYDAARRELISLSAKLAYPVREGIPIMLPSEARALDEDEIAQRKKSRD
jgi:uncharacterized protein YbaR (Trm112 family)